MTAAPVSPVSGRMQRVEASARLVAAPDAMGRTRLRTLHQLGAAKVRLPAPESPALEAVLINTAGGLTGGDRIEWQVEAVPGASVSITTQACERVYRSAGVHARASSTLRVGAGARLAWLPQETILFDRCAFERSLTVDLDADAELLVVEAVLFGRRAMGERVATGRFRDNWRVRCGGRLIHGEAYAIGPDVDDMLSRRAATSGGAAIATVLMVGAEAGGMLEPVRALLSPADGGASFWKVGETGKLLARLVATDGYELRRRLVPLLAMLNGKAGLPKTWTL